MNTVARAVNLGKRYGDTVALDGVSFDIQSGRIVGLIGPNGAGKTTALKALLGLTKFSGALEVLGMDPRQHRPKLMEEVCFIADVAILPRWIKVSQVLNFVDGVHPKFSRQRAEKFLQGTKIHKNQKVRQLSKGMVVQLHLAIVMAIDARFLVLDEPTLGLDILYRKEFYSRLLNDYFDGQRTILVTTHQVEEIEHILTDVMFLKDGKLALDTTMEAIPEIYTQLVAASESIAQARSLKPLYEQQVFGRNVFIYENAGRDQLKRLGEVSTPNISDLFVAKMKEGE